MCPPSDDENNDAGAAGQPAPAGQSGAEIKQALIGNHNDLHQVLIAGLLARRNGPLSFPTEEEITAVDNPRTLNAVRAMHFMLHSANRSNNHEDFQNKAAWRTEIPETLKKRNALAARYISYAPDHFASDESIAAFSDKGRSELQRLQAALKFNGDNSIVGPDNKKQVLEYVAEISMHAFDSTRQPDPRKNFVPPDFDPGAKLAEINNILESGISENDLKEAGRAFYQSGLDDAHAVAIRQLGVPNQVGMGQGLGIANMDQDDVVEPSNAPHQNQGAGAQPPAGVSHSGAGQGLGNDNMDQDGGGEPINAAHQNQGIGAQPPAGAGLNNDGADDPLDGEFNINNLFGGPGVDPDNHPLLEGEMDWGSIFDEFPDPGPENANIGTQAATSPAPQLNAGAINNQSQNISNRGNEGGGAASRSAANSSSSGVQHLNRQSAQRATNQFPSGEEPGEPDEEDASDNQAQSKGKGKGKGKGKAKGRARERLPTNSTNTDAARVSISRNTGGGSASNNPTSTPVEQGDGPAANLPKRTASNQHSMRLGARGAGARKPVDTPIALRTRKSLLTKKQKNEPIASRTRTRKKAQDVEAVRNGNRSISRDMDVVDSREMHEERRGGKRAADEIRQTLADEAQSVAGGKKSRQDDKGHEKLDDRPSQVRDPMER